MGAGAADGEGPARRRLPVPRVGHAGSHGFDGVVARIVPWTRILRRSATLSRIRGSSAATMSPVTHFLAGWALAEAASTCPRVRRHVVAAGVVPDLDGLGVVADGLARLAGHPGTAWFERWHHSLLHGLPGALAVAGVSAALGLRGWRAFGLVLASFHLHLLCDLVGSRGPDPADLWAIHYLAPFGGAWEWSWRGQWALNGWPNLVFTAGLIAWALARAVARGASPVSVFHAGWDAVVVTTLRTRFPRRPPPR